MKPQHRIADIIDNSAAVEQRYFMIHKPYNMVSQFISNHKVPLLGDLNFKFPEGTHAIGRLDSNSEGLLLLTTDKRITKLLFESSTPHVRTYLVQVKHVISQHALNMLRNGVTIRVKGGGDYITAPCEATLVDDPDVYFNNTKKGEQYPPFSWIILKIKEGKYHQVRKMVAAVSHQCKRLIRIAIEDLHLGMLAPGEVIEMEKECFFCLLNLAEEPAEAAPAKVNQTT